MKANSSGSARARFKVHAMIFESEMHFSNIIVSNQIVNSLSQVVVHVKYLYACHQLDVVIYALLVFVCEYPVA